MRACTIIARNYLAHARVLAESFLRHHPDSSFTVLVIDGAPSDDDAREPFETLLPTQVGLDEREFQRMAMIYDVLELATAVKPWLLRHLLADGGVVAYFDPDIEVFEPLDEISAGADEHGIVLTPHITDAAPREGNEFSEDAVLAAGVYNLGFIGVGEGDETQRFLDWWMERVARECVVDPARGRFVDQRWVDFVPSLFDAYILRDPAYNVAWWNLANRELSWTGARYEVNGKPLRFFHFSGYSPDEPAVLSKHQGPAPPVLLSEQPALARICGEYAEHLLAAGFREAISQPYGFASLPGGLPLDRRMRRIYRAELIAAERGEVPEPPSPFDARQPERFIEWLQEPADPMGLSGKISRYLAAVYADRPDLHVAFPNLRWLHADDYLEWVRTSGRRQEAIPAEFVPGPTRTPARKGAASMGRFAQKMAPNLSRKVAGKVVPPLSRQLARRRSRASPVVPATSLLPGVNVAGYFRAELGVGEAARHLIAGIKEAHIPYSTITYEATTSRQEHRFEAERAGEPVHDTNIICVNADQILTFVREVGPELLAHRYTIAVWWWEIGHFPEFLHDAFQVVDEVWVGSDFVAEAVGAATSKPVMTLPLGIEEPKVKAMSRDQLGLREGFVFLFSFDFLSVFERKNPLGLIDAFERAFAPGEGPTLVLKSINGDQSLPALEKLRLAAKRPDILVVDEYLSSEEKNALMAACDAYVSLHRSEGFGLTMAEAMALGKPVIATGYSGNLMFMNDENSYLVPYSLAAIPPGCEPYPAGVEWAEPDVEAAAKLMRQVYERQDEARAKGARARDSMREQHGPERTAAFLTSRLDEIRRTPAAANAAQPDEAPRPERPLQRAAEYLVAGPRNPLSAPGRIPLGRFARRALLRLLRPYIVRHQEFDEAVVGSLRELDEGLRRSRSELEAQLQRANEQLSQQLGRVEATSNTGREELVKRLATFESEVSKHLNAIDANLTRVLSELHTEPYMSDPKALRTKDAQGREAIGFAGNDLPASAKGLYRGLEDIFRGPEEFIRERQRGYVELIADSRPVLDVGCGRGEFLDLLAEAEIEASGIDIDEGMVAYCREKGHDVQLADANVHLDAQSDGAYGAIFAAQVVEHMPYEELVRFFGLVQRKLAPGGVFVAETVNPHSIPALKAFWVDPTHRNPIFPEVAAALAALHGFEAALIVFPAGTGKLEEDRITQGEYALVATKQGVEEQRARSKAGGAVTEPVSQAEAPRIREGEPLRRRAT